jgi:hypothetical protein
MGRDRDGALTAGSLGSSRWSVMGTSNSCRRPGPSWPPVRALPVRKLELPVFAERGRGLTSSWSSRRRETTDRRGDLWSFRPLAGARAVGLPKNPNRRRSDSAPFADRRNRRTINGTDRECSGGWEAKGRSRR